MSLERSVACPLTGDAGPRAYGVTFYGAVFWCYRWVRKRWRRENRTVSPSLNFLNA